MWIYIATIIVLLWLVSSADERKDDISFLKGFFSHGYGRWFFFIFLLEILIALLLSPTTLRNYIPFNWLANSPYAIHSYIALTVVLIIPKSIILYYVIESNPLTLKSTFVISLISEKVYPAYTPASTIGFG